MNTPTHAEIVREAERIWRARGRPMGRDLEIWLEAERALGQRPEPADERESFIERAKSETAAESVVEYQITPARSEQEAIEAAIQKPTEHSPAMKPPPSGKAGR